MMAGGEARPFGGGALEAWGNAPRSPSRRPQSATPFGAAPARSQFPDASVARGQAAPSPAFSTATSASPRSRPQSARPHRPPVIVDGEHVWVKTSSPLHNATAPLLRIEGAALAAASPREQTLEGRLSASQQRADALDARTLEARNRVLLRRTLSPPPRASPPPERSPPPAPRLSEFKLADDGAHRPAGENRTSKVGMSGVARVHSAGFPRRGGLASKSSHQYARAAAALAGGYRPPSPPQPRLPPREAAVSAAAGRRTTAADAAADADAAPASSASAQQMLEAVRGTSSATATPRRQPGFGAPSVPRTRPPRREGAGWR